MPTDTGLACDSRPDFLYATADIRAVSSAAKSYVIAKEHVFPIRELAGGLPSTSSEGRQQDSALRARVLVDIAPALSQFASVTVSMKLRSKLFGLITTISKRSQRPFCCALLGICLIVALRVAAQQEASAGALTVAVVVSDANGQSCVPGAVVTLSGPAELKAESDSAGILKFSSVVPGTYQIKAEFPGLAAEQTQEIKGGIVTSLTLELKPAEIKSSITVSAEAENVAPATVTPEKISATVVSNAPTTDDRAQSLLPMIPGVVRGPDGHINMKGTRATQSGALVNSANVTDPATGSPGLDLPVDVVASVQVISDPYDPQYGKLTGAVSTIETKTSNYEKFHFSVQNIFPRVRVRDGTVFGIGGATPRMTFTGPLVKDRVAFTQSIEYRFIRTPVNSLPAFQRDTTLEGVNTYSQLDLNVSAKQTATVSLAVYPQKLRYLGLNTFTPQPSTPDYHQRGYQLYAQDRYIVGKDGLLSSQLSYKVFDTDITPNGSDPYQLFVETTEGAFFNPQARRSKRVDLQEMYQFAPRQLGGTHQLKVGLNYSYSTYDGRQTYHPVQIEGVSGQTIENISFTQPTSFGVNQHEVSWFAGDQWIPFSRLTVDAGLRFDSDTITSSVHAAPRVGTQVALTKDGRTLLKGGAGIFYDRVPLMIPAFPYYPDRTVSLLDSTGQVTSSTAYVNTIAGGLRNPRSVAWNVALSRQVLPQLIVQVGYQQRNTRNDFIVQPVTSTSSNSLQLDNSGHDSYREFQVSAKYKIHDQVLNFAYVHSRAYGDLNDFTQFFGNLSKPVVQANGQGRLSFDAPNRFLAWGEVRAPWKLTFLPVYDLHTGFPYSVQDEYRNYIGPRNAQRFPWFESLDLQLSRPFAMPLGSKHLKARAGISVFNVFNHDNPRDVQSIAESSRFGQFFNDAWREYRGKLVFEF